MSISADIPVTRVHPLPNPEFCPYGCRPGPISPAWGSHLEAPHECLLGEGHQPGACSEAKALTTALCPTLADPFVATKMHCPSAEPLEAMLLSRRESGWIPDFDALEAGVAAALMCGICGGRLAYVALTQAVGIPATAWAICVTCRHWIEL